MRFVNRAMMQVNSTGTGALTLGNAVAGYQSLAAAGVLDGETVQYAIEDGFDWELGTGTYDDSAKTLTRTVTESSDSGSAISVSTNARVFVTASASTFENLQTQIDEIELFALAGI